MDSKVNEIIQSTLEILEKNKSHGNNFNLLKICGVSNSEVFTHTPILKELLDPQGSHGQKEFFLKSFVKFFNLDFKIETDIRVKREQRFNEYGQIDLIVENATQMIIIENKIHAADQPKQLERYFNFCKQYIKKQPLLIYLTLFGSEPSYNSLGCIKNNEKGYYIETDSELFEVNLRCLSYQNDIIDWLKSLICLMPASSNLQSALLQYINVISILTDEIQTGKKELKNMMLDITQNELQAIKQIASQFYSNSYRGELLFKLFEYFEHECIKIGEFEKSDDFLNIQYTKKNCHQWFKQVSPKNSSSQRDVIGCVLKSTRNPNVNFLFVAATDYLHYGVALSEECHFKLSDVEQLIPSWGQPKQWKKIPDGWISKGLGDLRAFSGDAFKLLSVKDNIFLDDFINDRLQEVHAILNL